MPTNRVTNEEQRKLIERDEYELQKFKESNKIKNERMMKVKEYHLKKFSLNVQMHTCVMFFPHTVSYIMVEKVPEEGAEDFDESAEPVMVEKRICEVANTCALKYEEFMVVEAKEIQLTSETLEEMFLMERNVLESFSPRLVDELLSKKVFSVLLSLPVIKNEGHNAIEDEDFTKYWGVPEEKMSTIIYGNQNPVNPSPKSLAADNIVVNNFGEKVPSMYTPTNPLSKASALTVLFNKFSITNQYVAPQPPVPQYLMIFEINKSDIVLPIIEDIEDNIINYGFFRSADPENPRLLCKNHELLVTYGMEKIGKDAKLVLSVIKDYKDKSMLRFIDAGPIYVSTDSELGIDDAAQFFPYNFEEIEGEIKMLVDRFFHNDEATDGEYELDEGNDEFLGEDDIDLHTSDITVR
ncbi:Nucleoside diphosphate kinase-like domain,Domain of unknown function DUF4746 [Cinara cedri]|uniref:DUF4746 domain-containing protein n=1 Tax=Cinara cedri TaxID=506608 RepID=A0A5E4MZW4_9HEMI|nr:Nucleoside diphosphate kinase-like domain,Domain of unknown function DUF4746 [Cinara cedri]